MYIFTESEIKQLIELDEKILPVIEDAFTQLATKKVVMPPIMRVDVKENNGEVDVKTAYIPGKEMFALKVSSGFFNNYQLGLPSANGLMMLISSVTGEPKALLLDNGYLTEVRTAAAGAIVANLMAKKQVHTVGIIGTGAQARYQAKALKLVRDFEKVLVYGRSNENAIEFKQDMEDILQAEIEVVNDPETLVRQSDIVVTTTPATEPIIQSKWLHPGLHITAMGSDAEEKQELAADVLKKADRFVCDTKAQCARLGELHHSIEQGFIEKDARVIELGEVTSGKEKGRESDEEITVCDLTGTGVQDTAIALLAYQLLTEKEGVGLQIDNKKSLHFT